MFVKEMDEGYARRVLMWHYEEPYDLYNSEISTNALTELLNGSYFVVGDAQDQVIGYFCIGESAQVPAGSYFGAYPSGFVDVGIGMKPELTGKGFGTTFFSFILDYIKEYFGPVSFRLTVDLYNTRAIHLYEKLGFNRELTFHFEDSVFITMVKA